MQTWCYGRDLLGPPLFEFTDSDGLLKLKLVFVAVPTGYGVFTHHQQHYQHLPPPPPPNCPFILFSSFSDISVSKKFAADPRSSRESRFDARKQRRFVRWSSPSTRSVAGGWVVVVVGCTAVGYCWKMGLQKSYGTMGLVCEDAIACNIYHRFRRL